MDSQWVPNRGPQMAFLRCSAYEAFYGGAAGPGKSEALLVGAVRFIADPNYTAIIFRRNFTELERTLIKRSHALYRPLGGKYNGSNHVWRFPSGAEINFGHLQHEHSVYEHQGTEYQYIAFDELTHFTEHQYRYMLTRGRSSKGVPLRIRSGSNPGGPGHDWVFKRWGAWLDPKHPRHAAPGETRWYAPDGHDGERETDTSDPDGFGRAFFPGLLKDNPKGDPRYASVLAGQDALTRARLLNGDWLAKPAAGIYFKRSWVKQWFDKPPPSTARVRYWDLAAGGDYAVGLLYSRCAPLWCVEDVERLRGTPYEVRKLVFDTAARDGHDVNICVEQDPGQAGKDQAHSYMSAPELQGYTVRFRPKRISKVTAFGPFSSQVEAGLVAFVRGAWNVPFFEECEAFPEGDNDDQCDAASGAHAELTGDSWFDDFLAANG